MEYEEDASEKEPKARKNFKVEIKTPGKKENSPVQEKPKESIMKKPEQKAKKSVVFNEKTEDNEGIQGETKDDSDSDLSFDAEEL